MSEPVVLGERWSVAKNGYCCNACCNAIQVNEKYHRLALYEPKSKVYNYREHVLCAQAVDIVMRAENSTYDKRTKVTDFTEEDFHVILEEDAEIYTGVFDILLRGAEDEEQEGGDVLPLRWAR